MARREELTEEQWVIIAPLIPEPPRREDGRGRPWKDSREVMNGILWVLRSGARWEDLPERFPPYQTCHRRFQQWVREGVLRSVLEALAEDLRARGELDLQRFSLACTGKSTTGDTGITGTDTVRAFPVIPVSPVVDVSCLFI